MPLFYCRDVAQTLGAKDIFQNVDFIVEAGEKTALIGPNGIGKTTLLRILAGIDRPVRGDVFFPRPIRRFMLVQKPEFKAGMTVHDYLADAAGVSQGFVGEALRRFGLAGLETGAPDGLSGGEKTRLQLARIWLDRTELLLLDEPTNHLDAAGLDWLEEFIRSYSGTIIVVSHDRYFLDRTVTRVLELAADRIASYPGGYSDYRRTKEARFREDLKTFYDQEKEDRKLRAAIAAQTRWAEQAHRQAPDKAAAMGIKKGGKEFLRVKAKKIDRRAKNTIKRLERLRAERLARPREAARIDLEFRTERHGRRLLSADGLGKSYGGRRLFAGCSLAVGRGEKIALTGPNGAGKSTLLRILAGLEQADTGTIWRSPTLRLGRLEQEHQSLAAERSALAEVMTCTADQRAAYELLAGLLLRAEAVHRPCAVLSMGERVRVALAKLLLGPYDLLLLDEPANYLDLPSRERLEDALVSFAGAMIVVSHDRYLLDRVCGKVWAIEDGRVCIHQGGRNGMAADRIQEAAPETEMDRLTRQMKLAEIADRLAGLDQEKDREQYEHWSREYQRICRRE